MPYFAYMLHNQKGQRYLGISSDPQSRLLQHNSGLSTWTANHGPWHLVWTSRPLSLGDARRLELSLKRQKGGSGLDALLRDFGS